MEEAIVDECLLVRVSFLWGCLRARGECGGEYGAAEVEAVCSLALLAVPPGINPARKPTTVSMPLIFLSFVSPSGPPFASDRSVSGVKIRVSL